MEVTIDNYDLDLSGLIAQIGEERPRRVLLQLPDGFKYSSSRILAPLRERFPDTLFYVWLNTDYGSCDMPLGLERLNFDLLVHFGHAQWR